MRITISRPKPSRATLPLAIVSLFGRDDEGQPTYWFEFPRNNKRSTGQKMLQAQAQSLIDSHRDSGCVVAGHAEGLQ